MPHDHIELELVMDEKGNPLFLNFWDNIHGNDVCISISENPFIANNEERSKTIFTINSDDGIFRSLTFKEFCDKVHKSVAKGKEYLAKMNREWDGE